MATSRQFQFAGEYPPRALSRGTRRARRENGALMFGLRGNHPRVQG